jgi:glycosyltransferase involved in cell wall biosynthesis
MRSRSRAGRGESCCLAVDMSIHLNNLAESDMIATSPEMFSPSTGRNIRSKTRLAGKRVGMVMFSHYPADPRPRRAIETLVKEGATVDLICEWEDKSQRREVLDGLEITRIPIKHQRGGALSYIYQYSAFILISAAILGRRLLRKRYDLVYVHNMPDVLVMCALLPKLFGAKVILDQHDPMPELMKTIFNKDEKSLAVRVIRRLERWSIARADLVITVNIACKRIFSARSCSSEKIGVVMNSPDEEIFHYRAARSYSPKPLNQPLVIMYHGSLVERNGLSLAIDAVARLHKTMPAVELRVYGRSTPYLEQMMEKVHSLGLENSVRYLGSRKLEDLVHDIQDCHVGIIPNQRNTFTDINTPTRIFEYLALGKPVIAPNTPGIRDYFDSESLVFFEPGNSEDLAKKLEFVAFDAASALSTTENGQRVYLAHAWQEERETLVGLVARLLQIAG